MPDTVAVNYLWPPKWDGNPPEPGQPGWKRIKVNLTCESDGTGETNVRKIDISELRNAVGAVANRTVCIGIEYNISGLNVLLEWDRAPHKEIARLLGFGGAVSDKITEPRYDDSDGTDGTGDILLTTTKFTDGDGYDITLHLELL